MAADSLRSRCIEAGARAWCEANGHFFDSCVWEEAHLVNAGLALDAILDCLTENLDETVHVRHDETVDRTEPWRLGDAFLACWPC